MPIPDLPQDKTELVPYRESKPISEKDIIFTGNERKKFKEDGSYILWQEYQFGKGGPKIWLNVKEGKPPTKT